MTTPRRSTVGVLACSIFARTWGRVDSGVHVCVGVGLCGGVGSEAGGEGVSQAVQAYA